MDAVLAFGAIAAVFLAMHVRLIQRYSKTKDKPSLYFSIACILWAVAAVFGVSEVVADALNLPLTMLFYRTSATSGMLGYLFLNIFAVAMAKSDEKVRNIWIPFIPFLAIISIVWVSDPVARVHTTEFTLTSMYKAPYGLPLIETILALMVVMAIYPVYLFVHISRVTKGSIIEIKSLLMGIGIFIGTIAYAIEVTGAVSLYYMPIYRPTIFIGSLIAYLSYTMPKWLERKLSGRAPVGAESIESFIEQFFVHPIGPSTQSQLNAFSKNLGLNHQQMVGRKILLGFEPESRYEKAIQDFAAEALANVEPIVVFTRSDGAIHSSLSGQKAVKFFCLTPQTSVPKELSENEMLLPSNDVSLMLDVFDKTLKAHPNSVINVVFDSLSDLVLSVGFEKTYRFMRYAIEILASPRNTVVFLLNQTAHDPMVTSSLRGLFNNQTSFTKDGIKIVKLPKVQLSTTETDKDVS
jgi:hypothetical protein